MCGSGLTFRVHAMGCIGGLVLILFTVVVLLAPAAYGLWYARQMGWL